MRTPHNQIQHILNTYGTSETRNTLLEDLQVLNILSQVKFREDQVKGQFTDQTGDSFLRACLAFTKMPEE